MSQILLHNLSVLCVLPSFVPCFHQHKIKLGHGEMPSRLATWMCVQRCCNSSNLFYTHCHTSFLIYNTCGHELMVPRLLLLMKAKSPSINFRSFDALGFNPSDNFDLVNMPNGALMKTCLIDGSLDVPSDEKIHRSEVALHVFWCVFHWCSHHQICKFKSLENQCMAL